MIIIKLSVERTAEDQGAPYAAGFEEYKVELRDEVPIEELQSICELVTNIIVGDNDGR